MDVQEGYMLRKIMMFLVATKVVASQPAERRPTGKPTVPANRIPQTYLKQVGPTPKSKKQLKYILVCVAVWGYKKLLVQQTFLLKLFWIQYQNHSGFFQYH